MNTQTPNTPDASVNKPDLPQQITEQDIKKFQLIESVRSISEEDDFSINKMSNEQVDIVLQHAGKLLDHKHEKEMTTHKENMKDKNNSFWLALALLVFALIIIIIVAIVDKDSLLDTVKYLIVFAGGGGIGFGIGQSKSNNRNDLEE